MSIPDTIRAKSIITSRRKRLIRLLKRMSGTEQDAIREINDALSKKGDSSAQARTYGVNFIAYFPYLKVCRPRDDCFTW